MGSTGVARTLDSGNWTDTDIPDLSGRVVLITGATSGLGLQSALALAEHGAQVILAGRSPEKLRSAEAEVVAVATGSAPTTVDVDLASLTSIRAAAEQVGARVGHLDVLLNNAGVMAPPKSRTTDGFELQIGTNHLGHFALTGLLMPLLLANDESVPARVVTVSSAAHRMGGIDLGDLNYENRSYSAWSAYGASKLANLLFTSELDRRAGAAGLSLVAAAAHPGYAATNLQYAGPRYAQNVIGKGLTAVTNRLLGQSAKAGAWPQLYAATGPDVRGNDYFGPTGLRETRGNPGRVGRSRAALDEATAAALWDLSTELTGVAYPFH